MRYCQLLALALVTSSLTALPAAADEVRYYVENGVTYRETRRMVRRPVVETQWQETAQTVYR